MTKKPEIKNLKKTADRIIRAVKKKEKIILYGDADLDGVSSVIILKESIQNLGGNVTSVFFPDRENDGYGITEGALEELKHLAPALLISVDLGIGNFREIKIAKKMGFEVIVIDHHQILEGKIPAASIVVDPKQKGDNYPFKGFANVGIIFKLAEELFKDKFSENLKNSFLELTAIATIADMMPQTDDNKLFIEKGLGSIHNTFRPGLKAFFEIINSDVSSYGNIQSIISALNSCERIDRVNETYLVLTSSSVKEARVIAENLISKAQGKQYKIKEIIREVEARVLEKPRVGIIFEGDASWPLILAGPVASAVVQRFDEPVFIYRKGSTESVGSVRVPKDVNSVDAMAPCSNFLISYGGHPPASGFRIKNENLARFKECLIKYFKEKNK